MRAILFTLVLLSAEKTADAQASAFASGPYLTQLGSRSVVVRVETESAEALTLTVAPGGLTVKDDAPKVGVHSLALDHLQPKTTYRYTVASAHGAKEDGAFTTAPADDDTGDVHFVLYGDSRGGTPTHELIVKRIASEQADFLVGTGDLVADGRNNAQWESYFDIEGELLRDHCLFTTIGNHELVEESGASFLRYFGTAEEQQKHVLYSTFRWGFLRFFVLDSEGSFLGEDRQWLERELQKSETEPNVAWRIAVLHDGPFASGLHGDNSKLWGADVPKLLRQHHIDFVFAGHDHIYERGASDGLRYVVSGGAGAPLYPVKHLRSSARKVESAYHYVVFEVGTETGKLTAKRIDGSVIEEIGFTKHDMWNDDGPAIAPASTKPTTAPVTPGGSATPDDEEDHPKEPSGGRGAYVVVGLVLVAGASLWYSRRKSSKS
jgi:predicted phosphodiesterase